MLLYLFLALMSLLAKVEQAGQPGNQLGDVSNNKQAKNHHNNKWHNRFDHLRGCNLCDLLSQEQSQANGRRDQTQSQVKDNHDTEVDGVAAQFNCQHTQNGTHNHVDGVTFHQHAQNQQQNVEE